MSQPLPHIPTAPPKPVHILETTTEEMATLGAIVDTLSEKLRALPSVVKQHTTADYVDIKLDNGTMLRVHVAVLR